MTRRLLPLLLAAALGLSGCTAVGAPEADFPACGPPSFDAIGGEVPAHLPERLDAFLVERALCEGLWLPRADRDFVPQGVALIGDEAVVSGYDGGGPEETHVCRLLRVDLTSGRQLADTGPITGAALGNDLVCRHGGGVVVEEDRLWVVATRRLWLLDPDTLEVRRIWQLEERVWGSWLVIDDRGRLGIGAFRDDRPGRLWWFDVDSVLAAETSALDEATSVGDRRVTSNAQGALWGDLGPGRPGLWLTVSNTLCGVLLSPGGRRIAFLPGAEGLSLSRDDLWAVSESATRIYQARGGRPVVPMLARFDLTHLAQWPDADCTP